MNVANVHILLFLASSIFIFCEKKNNIISDQKFYFKFYEIILFFSDKNGFDKYAQNFANPAGDIDNKHKLLMQYLKKKQELAESQAASRPGICKQM